MLTAGTLCHANDREAERPQGQQPELTPLKTFKLTTTEEGQPENRRAATASLGHREQQSMESKENGCATFICSNIRLPEFPDFQKRRTIDDSVPLASCYNL
jgi:hypothetical protein